MQVSKASQENKSATINRLSEGGFLEVVNRLLAFSDAHTNMLICIHQTDYCHLNIQVSTDIKTDKHASRY